MSKFIAKTWIQHGSLVVTIPEEVVDFEKLSIKHGTTNFVSVDIQKITRDYELICCFKYCNKKAVVSLMDTDGINPYCLKHYRIIKQCMKRKIKNK